MIGNLEHTLFVFFLSLGSKFVQLTNITLIDECVVSSSWPRLLNVFVELDVKVNMLFDDLVRVLRLEVVELQNMNRARSSNLCRILIDTNRLSIRGQLHKLNVS